MSEKEIIERLIGIIERLLDENERLRNRYITGPSITYHSVPTTVPKTYPAPIVTCNAEVDA